MSFAAGRQRLHNKLTRRIPDAAKGAAKIAVISSAYEVANLQYGLAPEDDGDLRNSIEVIEPGKVGPKGYPAREAQALVTAGGPRTTVSVGDGKYDYDYAFAVEYGTKEHVAGGKFEGATIPKISAQPFFWPAWRALRTPVKRKITRAINKAIKDGAK